MNVTLSPDDRRLAEGKVSSGQHPTLTPLWLMSFGPSENGICSIGTSAGEAEDSSTNAGRKRMT